MGAVRAATRSPSAADSPGERATSGDGGAWKRKPKGDCCTTVIAADTIEVTKSDGTRVVVRRLGVAGPATRAGDGRMERLGEEAADDTRRLLLDRAVRLEHDSVRKTDERDRALAHVDRAGDRRMLNKDRLAMGWAFADGSDPRARSSEFRSAEADARSRSRGVWAAINRDEEDERAQVTRARAWLQVGDDLRAKDPDAARKWSEDILRQFPATAGADAARSRLKRFEAE